MRKIWSIILVSVMLGAVSCGGDDDKNPETPGEIIGTWELQDMKIGILETSEAEIRSLAREIFEELSADFTEGETIEFYDNGKGRFDGESIQFSIDRYTLTIVDGDGYKMKYSYAISGGKLILTMNMREIIITELAAELNKEELDYLKKTLKQFTIDFIYVK